MIIDLHGTDADFPFPDPTMAERDPNGLLAIGGDLSVRRLLNAYSSGVFPWYGPGRPILWWSPAPRMVLFPAEMHVSRSLRRRLRGSGFGLSVNSCFESVLRNCAAARAGHAGTWLVDEMIEAYCALRDAGHAHSIEIWESDSLVGGLYGVAIGQMFFGESMFSHRPDASKIALMALTHIARKQPYSMIDCQVYSDHLASLGAREIDRRDFLSWLRKACVASAPILSGHAQVPAATRLLADE